MQLLLYVGTFGENLGSKRMQMLAFSGLNACWMASMWRFCPQKGTALRCIGMLMRARAGLSKPGNFQGALAGWSHVAASAAGSVPGRSAGRLTNQG